ncbi:MAG: YfdX family protein [Pseudomonadota bacterium]
MNTRHPIRATLLVPLALSAALLSARSYADNTLPVRPYTHAAKPYTDSERVVENPGWANPYAARAAAQSGRALIDHLQAARAFISDGSAAGARNMLTVAGDFDSVLLQNMPFLAVSDNIRNAQHKLVGGDITATADTLLPIYAQLDDMQVYAPKLAQHSRDKLHSAEAQARNGDKQGASQTLSDVANEIQSTTVYLPLGKVQRDIQAAKADLNHPTPNLAAAKQAVDRALGSLVSENVRIVALPRG